MFLEKEITMEKLIAKNPVAYHNYTINDKLEAGIVLTGTEIKSIRAGKVNLKDSYITIKNGEAFIFGMHISPYEHGNIFNKDPLRTRKLLLNRKELNKLLGLISQKGMTIVPIQLYFKNSFVKLEIGIGKGKKLYDKREDIAKKEAQIKIQRILKNNL
jgi:SsrA-binding protein